MDRVINALNRNGRQIIRDRPGEKSASKSYKRAKALTAEDSVLFPAGSFNEP